MMPGVFKQFKRNSYTNGVAELRKYEIFVQSGERFYYLFSTL